DDRGFLEVGLEQVLVAELDQVADPGLLRVLGRLADALRIDVDADRLDAVFLRRGDRDTAVAGTQVVEHVALAYVGKAQHVLHHLVRRRHVDHVGVLLWRLVRGRLGEERVRRHGKQHRGHGHEDSHAGNYARVGVYGATPGA